MLVDLESISIFIRPIADDMRRQSNGLSVILNERMRKNPGSGNLFLVCSWDNRVQALAFLQSARYSKANRQVSYCRNCPKIHKEY